MTKDEKGAAPSAAKDGPNPRFSDVTKILHHFSAYQQLAKMGDRIKLTLGMIQKITADRRGEAFASCESRKRGLPERQVADSVNCDAALPSIGMGTGFEVDE